MQTARTVGLSVASALGFALLTGCAGPSLHERSYQYLEASAKAYSVPPVQYGQGVPDNGRAAHAREDMRKDTHEARAWVNSDRRTRVTTAGPVLSAYGVVGASGYTDVSRCTIDVSLVVNDEQLRRKFVRMCYDLLPAKDRELIYRTDESLVTRGGIEQRQRTQGYSNSK